MGLDMYLIGEKYFYRREHVDGERQVEFYKLGYWRKHPNLHGFIVKTFADSVDQCQEIVLSEDNLLAIIQAITAQQLPVTTGFFFGVSENTAEQIAYDIQLFQNAISWLKIKEEGVRRTVSYQASW